MANYNVQGFGGVRFSYGNNIATFPYGFGEIAWSPEFQETVNPSKKIFRKKLGWRARVECRIISAEDGMYEQIQALITILNESFSANAGITIEPEYAVSNNNNLSLSNMLFNSDYSLEDIVKREGVQAITVKFIAQELLDDISIFVNATHNNRVTSLGDIRVTSLGDVRITR